MSLAHVILVLLAVLALGGVVAALVREVTHDGYGRRPAPCSHRSWDDGAPSS